MLSQIIFQLYIKVYFLIRFTYILVIFIISQYNIKDYERKFLYGFNWLLILVVFLTKILIVIYEPI